MKLLMVSYYNGIQNSMGGHRTRAMAKYLPDGGVDVLPLYLGDRPSEVISEEGIAVPGVSHFYTHPLKYAGIRAVQEFFRTMGWYCPILGAWRNRAIALGDRIVDEFRPDAVLCSYPPIEAMEIGLAISRRYSLPLIADFRDGLLFEPLDAIRLKHSCVRQHYKKVEKELLAHASLVLSVSEPISHYFRSVYGHNWVVTLANGYDPDDFMAAFCERNEYFDSAFVNIVHTGKLSASRQGCSIDHLIQALKRHNSEVSREKCKPVRLHFVGDLSGDELKTCRPLIDSGEVRVWGHKCREEAIQFQRLADALLLVVAAGQKSVATGKLFEYLAAKRPLLALAEGSEAGRIVNETGVGIVSKPDSETAIVEALKQLVSRLSLGELFPRNEEAIALYSRPVQMRLLADYLKQAIVR